MVGPGAVEFIGDGACASPGLSNPGRGLVPKAVTGARGRSEHQLVLGRVVDAAVDGRMGGGSMIPVLEVK